MANRITPPSAPVATIGDLDQRSREIFRSIVESYVASGEPVGSRTLSRHTSLALSPASIRNVMADLEELGLLRAPHASAGRLPTERGLRLFVDGLMESGRLSAEEQARIDAECARAGRGPQDVLESATAMLSGLSRCAGLVLAPKRETPLKHIEFVHLGPGRALVVTVDSAGAVENRVIESPPGTPPSALVEASNYLSARLLGRTLGEARDAILADIQAERAEVDSLASKVIEAGLASWAGGEAGGSLILHGRQHLLDDVQALEDLARIRSLFETLERKETMLKLVDASQEGEGVRIFIGAETELFGLAGCSVVIAPYKGQEKQVIGAIGVVGPTRLNYARIIPMVDYTADLVGRLIR